MSITPHDPEPSRGSGGGDGDPDSGLRRRVRNAVGAVVRRICTWVAAMTAANRVDGPVGGDRTGGEGSEETGLRRGAVAKLGAGWAPTTGSRSVTDDPDEPAGELPSRPRLRTDETADSLRLSRPGEAEAYLESDHWEDVER